MAAYNPKDHFFHKAKKEGYVARSAFKLEELQTKFKLFKRGNFVLDLGCAPGSWSQVALKLIGPEGQLIGIDLSPTKITAANARFIEADILKFPLDQLGGPFDLVISDMAPKTTGIRIRDQALSEELCQMAIHVADQHLRSGGHLVMKIFDGPDAEKLAKSLNSKFQKVARYRPEAVRKGSFEFYIVGLNKK